METPGTTKSTTQQSELKLVAQSKNVGNDICITYWEVGASYAHLRKGRGLAKSVIWWFAGKKDETHGTNEVLVASSCFGASGSYVYVQCSRKIPNGGFGR